MNATVDPDLAPSEGFHLAVFEVDGSLEGTAQWLHKNLAPQWLRVCEELLEFKGRTFDHRWTGELSHIRTKVTSTGSVGICTVYFQDHIASSMLMMTGREGGAETQVAEMFVSSLGVSLPSGHDVSEPFGALFSLKQRPLVAVVPIPDPAIPDEDDNLIRELSLHFASAFVRLSE